MAIAAWLFVPETDKPCRTARSCQEISWVLALMFTPLFC
jgi:hypothetical protein